MAVEIELKLRLPPEGVPQIRRSSLLKSLSVSRPVTRKVYTIYYDTPDFRLRKEGVALRLRREGRRWIQTVKGRGQAVAGMHHREEWEAYVSKPQPDLIRISETGLARLFRSEDVQKGLKPVFSTEFRRTSRVLRFAEDQEIEFCLDQGKIISGSTSVPICEIELELKDGNPACLYRLALDLLNSLPGAFPLQLENASKAERGYGIASDSREPPCKAKPIPITATTSLSDAFEAIAWNCLHHLHGNEAGVLEGNNTEYLHQMRVALRRSRSALSIFSRDFGKEALKGMGKELKWLSTQLGPARDWDAFIMETVAPVCSAFPQHRGLVGLREKSDKVREEYNGRARDAVGSRRYTELMLKLGERLSRALGVDRGEASEREDGGNAGQPGIQAFVQSLLAARHRQLRRYGKDPAGLDGAQLHALRIIAKKQRYAAEYFASLYAGKEAIRYIKALSRLQDILGAINDVAVAEKQLAELSMDRDCGDEREAAGIILGWCAKSAEARKLELKEAWKNFRNTKKFW